MIASYLREHIFDLKPLIICLECFFLSFILARAYAAAMGASPLLVGVIGATGGLTYSFMPLAAGVLSDKIRRKILIITSMLFYGLACTLYVLAENPNMLIPVKVMEWVAVATFWPSIEALITEFSGEKLEQNLRRFNLSWDSATIIGPVIVGTVISVSGAKTPFALSSAIAFALAFLATAKIKELLKGKTEQKHENSNVTRSSKNSTAIAIASIILFSFIGGIIYNLFPAHATSLGIPAYEIGIITFANGLFRLVAFTEAYKIEAKIGRITMFLAGSLTLAFVSALTAASSTVLLFVLAFSIFGFGMGILYAASIAHILRNVSRSKGYAAGIFESLIGVGNLLGSATGGLASEYFALNTPYILSLIVSLAAGFHQSVYLLKRRDKISQGLHFA